MIHGKLIRDGKREDLVRDLEFEPSSSVYDETGGNDSLIAWASLPAAGGGQSKLWVRLLPSKDLITHLADLDPIAFLDAAPDLIHRATVALAQRLTEAEADVQAARARVERMEAALAPEEVVDEAAV